MSTRWQIAAKLSDGRFACIYVHCDGYPSYALATLQAHYTDPQKIDALIALGDCLSVSAQPEGCETFASKGEDWDDICPSYGSSVHNAADKHFHGDEEYRYFWDGKEWSWEVV